MTHISIEEVFGINAHVKSYIEREHVDDLFKMALKSDKQILVYGASKQGKTALVSNYCDYDSNVVFSLTPETELIDIYRKMLKSAGVSVLTSHSEGQGSQSSSKARAKILASFAMFAKIGADGEISNQNTANRVAQYEEIPFNINQPQDISDLLKKAKDRSVVILENFHYLSYEKQKKFAYDLRSFQELGVRFIILGVWREKNRMTQFNGDLLGRVREIPVEPWKKEDFLRIVEKGEKILKIKFSPEIIDKCVELSFSSVGVFQDLLYEICTACGIFVCQKEEVLLNDISLMEKITQAKAVEYGSRHRRSLEAIASMPINNNKNKLYYHIVDILLKEGYEGIKNGMHVDHIHEQINKRVGGNKVKIRTVKVALEDIHAIQAKKDINPPTLSYDDNSSLLSVIDSTMYFFLKNANLEKFRDQLKDSFETRI